jgi:hypothetical protein
VTSIVDFLRARLDDDEQVAQAAGGDRWALQGHPSETIAVYDSARDPVVYDEGYPTDEQAEHIARHDPARVLAEVDAKRRILDEYALVARLHDEAAARISVASPRPAGADLDTWSRSQHELPIYDGVLRLLALPHRDHPDYRPEWAV